MKKTRIIVFDTTLRDGEQSPGCSMNIEEKVHLAQQLEKLKVDVIEAGFPIASDGDFEGVKAVSKIVKNCTIAGLCRVKKQDIDAAWGALKGAKSPRIHTFVATSDIHLEHKLRKTRSEVLKATREAVRYAAGLCPEVEFSAEDASRSDIDYVTEVFAVAAEEGAGIVNYPDTVGYAVPGEIEENISILHERLSKDFPDLVISVHCHNDLGLAVANSLAAIQAGASQVECTINGIGERAGNASLEEIVMAMNTRKAYYKQFSIGIKANEITRSSRLLTKITGMEVQRNKAIVGANAFAHEAGIHQDGVLKNAINYEIMTPKSVGLKTSHLVLGKHSGRHALKQRYDALGYKLDPEQLQRAYHLFTQLADVKKEVYDEDLMAIVDDEITKNMTESYIFKRLQITSGTKIIPMATVELAYGEDRITESATGDGPVDAACRAIERATGIQGLLLDYGIKSVTQGKDAVGEVTVRVQIDKKPFVGRAVSTDVVIASAKAYLDAVNRALFMRSKSKSSATKKTAAKRSAKKAVAKRSTKKAAVKKR